MTETWQTNDKINISRILSLWLTKFFLKLLAGLEASINMALGFSRSASTWNTKRNKVGHVDTTHFEHEAMDQILRQCPVSRNPRDDHRHWRRDGQAHRDLRECQRMT